VEDLFAGFQDQAEDVQAVFFRNIDCDAAGLLVQVRLEGYRNASLCQFLELSEAVPADQSGFQAQLAGILVGHERCDERTGDLAAGIALCVEVALRSDVIWTLEVGNGHSRQQFIQTVEEQNDTAEYLYNTYTDTLRSSDTWKKIELFNGERIKMSNGYGYRINKWAFPQEYYMAPVLVEVSGGAYYYQSSDKFYVGTGQLKSFSNTSYAEVADKYGRVSRNNFYLMKPKGTSHPKGEIKLYGNVRLDPTTKSSVGGHYSEVMSGKYDIYIVMVPNWYTTISDAGELDSVFYDSLYVDSIAALCKNKFKVQLRYNNGAASDATTKAVEIDYDAKKVDTIKVFENFTFPYSYKDLRFCYPTMIVQGSASSANLRNGYIRELCIDQVIMKGKEESEPVAD
jgi:hypothetical protein